MSVIGPHPVPRIPRKGQVYRRTCDGFVFRVESASRAVGGAFMQCVDAARIAGWFWAEDIARSFERAPRDARSLTLV